MKVFSLESFPLYGTCIKINVKIIFISHAGHFYHCFMLKWIESHTNYRKTLDYRNEEYQEDLWQRSFEFMKEHLSPEIMERYGPPPGSPQEPATGTASSGEPDQETEKDGAPDSAIDSEVANSDKKDT